MRTKMQSAWKYVDVPLSWAETIIVLSLLLATLVISFSQIVARWLGGGWPWADELVRYMLLWLGIFGAAPATRHHKHIAIDAFAQLLPETPRLIIRRITDLVAAALVFTFVKAISDYIGFVGDERSMTLGVTVGTLTWPIAVAFSWIGVRFLADAIIGIDAESSESPILEEASYEASMGEGAAS